MAVVALSSIQSFADQIASEFSPERVILFGSYASGTARPESDIDMLVIMPGEPSGARIAAEIISRLKPTLPLELIVRSTYQLKKRLDLNDYFLTDIMNSGKVLYAAPHQ